MSDQLTPHQKIVRASKRGIGLRLTPAEVQLLATDDAIKARAQRDAESGGQKNVALASSFERRLFKPERVVRSDAGGELFAPVDQHGRESGDTPSYGLGSVQRRCDELNRAEARKAREAKKPAKLTPELRRLLEFCSRGIKLEMQFSDSTALRRLVDAGLVHNVPHPEVTARDGKPAVGIEITDAGRAALAKSAQGAAAGRRRKT